MERLQIQWCDIQGKLFESSIDAGYDSPQFIKVFMNSEVARDLDSPFNPMQWAGEEYLLERMEDEYASSLIKSEKQYDKEVIYWIGYVYRYWHLLTGETSKKIYKQAPAKTMKTNYLLFHTMDVELAIEDLKEIYRQKL